MRLVAGAVFALAAFANTFTVNSTADLLDSGPGNGICAAGPGVCTLRAAIQEAGALAGSHTIVVPPGKYVISQTPNCTYRILGYPTELVEQMSALCVKGNVTIEGADAATTIIDANGQGGAWCCGSYPAARGLVVSQDAVVSISGLTVTHGRGYGGYTFVGGAGINNHGNLTLTDVILTANVNDAGGGGGIANYNQLTMDRCSVRNNTALPNSGYGGGIANLYSVALARITRTLINGNAATLGGGIVNFGGKVEISSSTISNNTGSGIYSDAANLLGGELLASNVTISGNTGWTGGGISLGQFARTTLNNATVAFNTAGNAYGGIAAGGTTRIRNSIIAKNTATGYSGRYQDCGFSLTSDGHNLIGDPVGCTMTGATSTDILNVDPNLGALGLNGGDTLTHAPSSTSRAIDAGNPGAPGSGGLACAATDQRGILRPVGSRCDIGAFERSGAFMVTGITPNSAGSSGSAVATISGSGLQPGASVRLRRSGLADIVGSAATVDEGNSSLAASFALGGAQQGVWNVVVTNPDNASVTLPSAFTVEAPGAPDLWVEIVGRNAVRAGSTVRYEVVFGNRGNVEAVGVPLSINVPSAFPFLGYFPLLPPPPQPGQVSADFSNVPMNVSTGKPGALNGSFFLPVIPPGYSGSLPFSITLPGGIAHGQEFTLATAKGDPFFRPLLDPTALSDFVAGAKAYAEANLRATISPTRVAQMTAYARNTFNQVIADGRDSLVSTQGLTPGVYSLAQMTIDVARYGAAAPNGTTISRLAIVQAGAAAPGANPCNGGVMAPGTSCGDKPFEMPPGDDKRPLTPGECKSIPKHYVSSDGTMCLPDPYQIKCPIIPNPFHSDPDCLKIPIKQSVDPNDKAGPNGGGTQNYRKSGGPFTYTVMFENLPAATAPAQTVEITDQLDTSRLDVNTFALGPISFGNYTITPPPGLKQFSGGIDLRPAMNLQVRVDAGLNVSTGVLTWKFTSLDPATNSLTDDVDAGFLPPNKNPPEGDGRVTFAISPRANLATGTTVCNTASIVFDVNAPILTPRWCNTFDDIAPKSGVKALSANTTALRFAVQWAGTDQGSAIRDYSVYVSDNGGAYKQWLADTEATQANFTGVNGHTYRFHSIARDLAGNTEAVKTVAEAGTKVSTACATNVTPQFRIVRGGYRYNAVTGRYQQTVTITRIAAGPIAGPFVLAVTALGANATVYQPVGTTACIVPRASYIAVNPGAQWISAQTVSVTVQFNNPTHAGILWTPILLAGSTY